MPRTETCEDLIVILSNVLAQIQHGAPDNFRAESVEMSYAHKALREARMWILEHERLNGDAAKAPKVPTMDDFLKLNEVTPVVRIMKSGDREFAAIDPVEQLQKLGFTINDVEVEVDAAGRPIVPEGYVLVDGRDEIITHRTAALRMEVPTPIPQGSIYEGRSIWEDGNSMTPASPKPAIRCEQQEDSPNDQTPPHV